MKQILVVEDDRDISALIKMNLQYAGYSVHQAFDGTRAESLLRDISPDLIILDLTLPGIDGLDLLPSLVERHIPVLIVSARDSVQQKVQGLETGADDYLVKPFEPLELLAENRGIPFSRAKLLERIWGYEADCDTRTVDMHITRLRGKIGPGIIETVYKEGYRIEA